MKPWARLALAAALVFAECGFAQDIELPCAAGDKACAFKALQSHPAKTMAFWSDTFKAPLEQRIAPAPAGLVELLSLDVMVNGFRNHPRASTLEDDFRADVRSALAEIPDTVKRKLEGKLAGIYFADDFGGTGFSDAIRTAQGERMAGFVVLDPTVLRKRNANGWATWKENTPFTPDSRFELKATIETPGDDNRKQEIQYILLHELGHVLSIGASFHPSWNLSPAKVPVGESYPFFELSWFVDRARNRYASQFEIAFPERKDVVYYFGAQLPARSMASIYESLEQTNFPTLYAATHPADDFAESFANYVHTVLMKKPFEIRISEDGSVARRYAACWEEKRCEEKRRVLEAFLR
jgi:hypothetical protein